MFDAIYYLAVVLVLVFAVFAILFLIRKQTGATAGLKSLGLFGPKPYRRLGVVEHASIDGKRRLILVRRDDVEHLIITGGPVDMVVETGIVPQSPPTAVDSSVERDLAALTDEPFPRDPPTLSAIPRDH